MRRIHDVRLNGRFFLSRGGIRPHSVLNLPPAVDDPVRIIQAAQIQLRRWRRSSLTNGNAADAGRVGEIITAREMLLRRAMQLPAPPRRGIGVTAPCEGVDSSHGLGAKQSFAGDGG